MPISPSVVRATTISASPDQSRRSAETSSTCIVATCNLTSFAWGTAQVYMRRTVPDVDPVLARLATARPRIAGEIARPHAEEALLAGVVTDLRDAAALPALAVAVGADGTYERCLLWGADPATGAEDLTLATALREVAPGAGRAVMLEAEPDLVVVTSSSVGAVDASV